jgi:ATP-dependent Clp protease ATP-binding subunit ClpB
MEGIVDLMFADLAKRMQVRGLSVTMTAAARDYIIRTAYDPVYGARPLRRFLQAKVETLLARFLIASDPAPDTVLSVDFEQGSLVIR